MQACLNTDRNVCMISTGTQTETIYQQAESLESYASISSAVSEWTPPDIDRNNNLDHHDVPQC